MLHITNTTDKDVVINVNGDDSRLELKLEGPGAVTIDNLVWMTREFRVGTPVTIAPGKSYDVNIASLAVRHARRFKVCLLDGGGRLHAHSFAGLWHG